MTRTTSLFLFFSAVALFLSSTDAFSVQQSRAVEGLQSKAASKKMLASILKMSEGEQEDAQSKISADGTFYDDEVSIGHTSNRRLMPPNITSQHSTHRISLETVSLSPHFNLFCFCYASFRSIRHPSSPVFPIR